MVRAIKDKVSVTQNTRRCDVCHIGILRQQYGTYTSWLGAHLVTLSGVAIMTCDVCDTAIYDAEIVARVEMLLGLAQTQPGQTTKPGKIADTMPTTVPASTRRWSA